MPNTEWWKQIVVHPYTDNEAIKIAAEYLNGLLERVMPRILVHHRKMIVKEIREEILRVWDKPLTSEDSYGFATAGKALALNDVLSLPCLKENE